MKKTERQHYALEVCERVYRAARREGVKPSTIIDRALGYRTSSIYRWLDNPTASRITSATLAQINLYLDDMGYDQYGRQPEESLIGWGSGD